MPSKLENQTSKISHRSSAGAQRVLHHYGRHQRFPELIDLLENMPGRIYQSDIINAFASILVTKPSDSQRDTWQPLKPIARGSPQQA
jgi:hypothetical protein